MELPEGFVCRHLNPIRYIVREASHPVISATVARSRRALVGIHQVFVLCGFLLHYQTHTITQPRVATNAPGERRPIGDNATHLPKNLCCGPSAPLGCSASLEEIDAGIYSAPTFFRQEGYALSFHSPEHPYPSPTMAGKPPRSFSVG
jgi:hypothetical protein